ncbi:MAG: DUF2793 domain-containing protein [Pseudomonadota bacterium]
MDLSPRLDLPYIQPSQAQKHVTHNSALERLDVLVQLVVEAFDATDPPAAPTEGEVWALGSAPTAAWADQGQTLAAFTNGAWHFIVPQIGWQAVGRADGALRVRTAGGWVQSSPSELQNLDALGIGATADPTNRLTVSSAATLLNHAGAGHQMKINKAATTDSASLLFQTDWAGRAEFGTTGNDDFSIKVSADGSTYVTALSIDNATGAAAVQDGLTVDGAAAYHQQNILGPVAQNAGVPSGAVIEYGSNANGTYVRWADGTQICWVSSVDMGSIIAYGSGTWASPYRTGAVSIVWPMPFVSVPATTTGMAPRGSALPLDSRALALNIYDEPTANGWSFLPATRIGGDNADTNVILSVTAIGRWI